MSGRYNRIRSNSDTVEDWRSYSNLRDGLFIAAAVHILIGAAGGILMSRVATEDPELSLLIPSSDFQIFAITSYLTLAFTFFMTFIFILLGRKYNLEARDATMAGNKSACDVATGSAKAVSWVTLVFVVLSLAGGITVATMSGIEMTSDVVLAAPQVLMYYRYVFWSSIVVIVGGAVGVGIVGYSIYKNEEICKLGGLGEKRGSARMDRADYADQPQVYGQARFRSGNRYE